MLYTTLQVGDKEFKLRMTAAAIVELEKKLGGNPLDILVGIESGQLPPLSSVLQILHAAMQKFHHNIKFQDVLELYDEYVESGKTYTDLLPVLLEVFEVSGFFKKPQAETGETNLENL